MCMAGVSDDGRYYTDGYSRTNQAPSMSFARPAERVRENLRKDAALPIMASWSRSITEFEADDGTVPYGFLLLPPNPTGRVTFSRRHLWGPAGQDGDQGLGRFGRASFISCCSIRAMQFFSLSTTEAHPIADVSSGAAIRHQFGGARVERSAHRAGPATPQLPLLDPESHRHLGMVERRLDDALRSQSALGAVQGRNRGCPGGQLAGLRLDLHRAVSGTGEG